LKSFEKDERGFYRHEEKQNDENSFEIIGTGYVDGEHYLRDFCEVYGFGHFTGKHRDGGKVGREDLGNRKLI
jgi:hypothetical protein